MYGLLHKKFLFYEFWKLNGFAKEMQMSLTDYVLTMICEAIRWNLPPWWYRLGNL
jgi:hypothetical protein